jgi:glycyl-tRNA synthetase
MEIATTLTGEVLKRDLLESMLKRRLFYTPAFEAYNGIQGVGGSLKGLFDYGPPGCSLQANIVALWRKHFILEEDMLEVDCTILTPAEVFKTSGHVDKFADWMCKDPVKGDFLRADHLVENVLEGRLKGDRDARGIKGEADKAPADAKKAKLKVKDVKAAKLDDEAVSEYENILAKVLPPEKTFYPRKYEETADARVTRSTTTMAMSSPNSSNDLTSGILMAMAKFSRRLPLI